MSVYDPSQIRNVVLAGHNSCGKTTLAEAFLSIAGATKRAGRTDDGTSTCDYDPEEIRHHMSISMAMAPFEVGSVKINLIDTPGYADFIYELRTASFAADLMAIVVSAVEGVEAQTIAAWELAEELSLPRLIIVNKLDRERGNFNRVLEEMVGIFGSGIAPLELPIGEEGSFCGIADLLDDKAIIYDGAGSRIEPIPDSISELEHSVREHLVEGIVVGDDELMERYLSGEMPSSAELEATLASGVAAGTVFPVVCASASTGIGVDRVAALIADLAPSPLSNRSVALDGSGNLKELACDSSGPVVATVFKTISDPYVGKVSLMKLMSGTLKPDCTLTNMRTHSEERLHIINMIRGKETTPLTEARAGDIVAVPKLSGVSTGDTLAAKGESIIFEFPKPDPGVYSIAISPISKGDEDKLMSGIHRLQDEDPALEIKRVDETRQTLLCGMGEMHLGIACERLHRKYGVEVKVEDILIPYKETITKPCQAEGKYKKQSGGHGQFGVASLKVEPLERGGGFEFIDAIYGGAIPKQFLPAVEKGVLEAMAQGGPKGFPVVDVRVTCFDGKFHSVDSSELSFKMAGALAFKEALLHGDPIVLEPISKVIVTVPSSALGDVLGDLNSRRAKVQGTEALPKDRQRIVAIVPTAEMQHYAVDLRALTSARGKFIIEHDHYDALPSHMTSKLSAVSAGSN